MKRPPPGYLPLHLRAPSLPPGDHVVSTIVGEQQALVVDPGSPFPAEQRRLERLLYRLLGAGGSLQGVLLTHHHRDHVGGALALATRFALPVFAHAETHARVPLGGVTRIMLDNEEVLNIDGGRRTLRVLHTPGHALGHLCLFEERTGVLLSGDMVLGRGTTLIDPDQGHMGDYLRSLRRLAALHPKIVLPGHGGMVCHGEAAIHRLIAHRVARERRVLMTLREAKAPLTALGVAREAYRELSPLLASLALRSTCSHLLELRRQGSALHGEKGWYALPHSG
ncbi:MAG: MBL fold metallo-hydrolase [Deltaproteobacteria bacterium]|nr:MBL fold metallo-hydrolase [Deltaproteobacteria bacterium]